MNISELTITDLKAALEYADQEVENYRDQQRRSSGYQYDENDLLFWCQAQSCFKNEIIKRIKQVMTAPKTLREFTQVDTSTSAFMENINP